MAKVDRLRYFRATGITSLVAFLFTAALPSAYAVHTWNNLAGGLYSEPDNWIGGVPIPGQQVIYNKPNTYAVDVDILADNGSVQFAANGVANVTLDITGPGYTIGQLKIGQSVANSDNRVTVTGSNFDPTDLELAPGINGRGSLTLSGSMHAGFIAVGGQISRGGQIAQTLGGAGILTLNPGAEVTTNSLMGYNGGAGSSIVFNGGSLTILGDGRFNSEQVTTFAQVGDGTHSAALNLQNNPFSPGQFDFGNTQTLTIRSLATVNFDSLGGNLFVGDIDKTGGAFNWIAGSINLMNAPLEVSATGQFGANIALDSTRGLAVAGATIVASDSSLFVSGGSFQTYELTNSGGSISYFGGSFTVEHSDVEISATGITNPALMVPEGGFLAVPNNILSIASGRFVSVNGGTLVAGSLVNHGVFGFDRGSLEIVSGDLSVGPSGALNNSLNLNVGPGSSIHVGAGALALQQTQTVTVSGGDVVARTITNSGTLEVSDGFLSTGRIYLGSLSGRFNVSDQGSISSTGIVADQMTVTGGSVFVGQPDPENPPGGQADPILDGAIAVGYGRDGELTISDGFVFAPSVKIGAAAGFAGKATINGGTLTTDNLLAANGARSLLTFNGGVIQSGHSEIDGAGPFTIGNGIDAAVFQMNGGMHRFADGLVLSASGSLAGEGTILGDVTAGGVLSPGQSPGLLAVTGNLQLLAENTLAIELGGQAPGVEYDQVGVSGTAQLNGKLAVSFVNEFVPAVGDSFEILTYASRAGQFSMLELPTIAGATWSLDYGATSLILSVTSSDRLVGDLDGDHDVDRTDAALFARYFGVSAGANWSTGDFDGDGATTLTDLAMLQAQLSQDESRFAASAAVPEPSTNLLVASGLAGSLFWRIRCRRAQ